MGRAAAAVVGGDGGEGGGRGGSGSGGRSGDKGNGSGWGSCGGRKAKIRRECQHYLATPSRGPSRRVWRSGVKELVSKASWVVFSSIINNNILGISFLGVSRHPRRRAPGVGVAWAAAVLVPP